MIYLISVTKPWDSECLAALALRQGVSPVIVRHPAGLTEQIRPNFHTTYASEQHVEQHLSLTSCYITICPMFIIRTTLI